MSKTTSDIAINICSRIINRLFRCNKERCFEFGKWIIMKFIYDSDKVKKKSIIKLAYADYYGQILDKINIEFKN